jgi:GABA permease
MSAGPERGHVSLPQTLAPRHVSMIAIGGIIGAGLFVGSSTAIAAVGPAVVVSYLLAGLIVMSVMKMLSELAQSNASNQSFPELVRGELGNWGGFLSGWLYWYFWVVVVAVEAIAGALLLAPWLRMGIGQLAALLLTALTGVNLLSTRSYAEFEFWFSSVKVAAIVLFIVACAAYALGITSPAGPTFANLTVDKGFAPFGVWSVLSGVTTVIFSLVGAEIVTVAAAEARNSTRIVARLATALALRVVLFYVLSIFLIVSIVPWSAIEPGRSPFAVVLDHMGVRWGATLMNVVVLIAILSCLNSGIYAASRVLLALGTRGDAPRWLLSDSARRVPVRAILFGSACSFIALAASFLAPRWLFSFLVNSSGAVILIVYLLVACAHIRLRRRRQATYLYRGARARAGLSPLSYITCGSIVLVLVAMALTSSLSSQLYCSVIATMIVLLAYWLLRRPADLQHLESDENLR